MIVTTHKNQITRVIIITIKILMLYYLLTQNKFGKEQQHKTNYNRKIVFHIIGLQVLSYSF